MKIFVSWSGELSHTVALALDRQGHYFVANRDDLPFLMRELPGVTARVRIHTRADWTNYDDLARKLIRYKDKCFGESGA